MADMFDVLRASLFTGEDLSLPDWRPVFEEMKQQAVAGLPGAWLPGHLDAAPWSAFCAIQQGQWVRLMHAQDQLLQLLEAHHIPCVILKGAAAAMAYPHPTLRAMGDVDFLVKRADLERTAALLETNGYALTHEKENQDHHYCYQKDGISFELHWRTPLFSRIDDALLARFEPGIDAREWHETGGYAFPTLPVTLNGLVLMLHIDQHLRSGLGLRQIIDWMMYIHTLPPEKWAELLPVLEHAGIKKLALTVTALCQKYLGLEKIVEEDPSLPVDALLAYILEQGNFGRKAGFDGKISSFARSVSTPGGFFRRLQGGGLANWNAAKKHAVLRPFAWVYQSFRILGMLIRQKRSPGAFLKHRRHGVEQRSLIRALDLELERKLPL